MEDYEGTPCYKPVPKWLTEDIFLNFIKTFEKDFTKILKFKVIQFALDWLRVQIKLELKDGNCSNFSCVMKLPVCHNGCSKDDYQREFHVYTVLIPEFENMYSRRGKHLKFAPTHFKLYDDRIPDDALFTEDVFKLGYTYVQRHLGLDMQQTETALEKLAQFHAASACYYDLHGPYSELFVNSKYDQDTFDRTRSHYMAMFLKCLPLYKDVTHLEDKLVTCGQNMRYPYDPKIPTNWKGFHVLNHGCANRIMIKSVTYNSHKNDSSLLEGFVMSNYSCPTLDLINLLLLSASIENKLKLFDHFVNVYHEKLVQNLKLLRYKSSMPTLREIHKAVIDKGEWAFFLSISVLPFFFDPSIATSMLDATIDNGEDEELKYFRSSKYIEHINEFLPWMIDRGFLDCKPEQFTHDL